MRHSFRPQLEQLEDRFASGELMTSIQQTAQQAASLMIHPDHAVSHITLLLRRHLTFYIYHASNSRPY